MGLRDFWSVGAAGHGLADGELKEIARKNEKPLSLFTMLVNVSVAVQRGNYYVLRSMCSRRRV
jgi:hypothetical protein